MVDGIYAIGVAYDDRSGARRFHINGTGFVAYYSNALWTNAHVVRGVRETVTGLAGANPKAIAVKAGSHNRGGGWTEYDLGGGHIHPDYDGTNSSPDIGLYYLPLDADATALSLLPREYFGGLHEGQPIGTLGFPGELRWGRGDGSVRPTFKDGTISAIHKFPTHYQIQHNFDVTGGTSGSAIFDHQGWVVAVNHAGFREGSLDFGIRADEVWEYIECCTREVALLSPEDTPLGPRLPVRPYPSDTYQPFPEDWNGETISP
ncbi:MAG: serine protease [Gemmatimonadota bacterium]|nr:serine protease [Gemmatimonadota bacterium]